MGLFASSFPADPTCQEAVVLTVDPIRFVCSIRTSSGRIIPNVPWLLPDSHSHFSVEVGDKVYVDTSLTYPVIKGHIPTAEPLPENSFLSISGAKETTLDAGNSSKIFGGLQRDKNKPLDFHTGDRVFTSEGGGILALLRTGSVMLRASSLASIFMSKFGDLVRITGRNYKRFSDVSSRVALNLKGRMYEWFGMDWDLARGKTNLERYNEAFGDILVAEVMRGEPDAVEVDNVAAKDLRVRKRWLNNETNTEIMIDTLFEDGRITVEIINNGGDTKVTQDNSLWEVIVVNGTTSRITVTPEHIDMNSNGHFCVIDATGVHMG
jgi:hypothetical protein